MKAIRKENIDRFLDCKQMAIAGASRKEKSFSAEVIKHLEQKGYELHLINPHFERGDKQYNAISELPKDIKHLLILTPKTQTEALIKEALDKDINQLWIQQMSETPSALELADKNGVNLVYGRCIFMFTQPEGIHKFHYRLTKFFGGIPK